MNDTTDTRPVRYGATKDRILRTLLDPGQRLTSWYKIAKQAGASYSWTHQVLSDLEDAGVLAGTHVLRPLSLFEAWAEGSNPPQGHDFMLQHPERLFTPSAPAYAWTTYWAENLVQHHLFPRRLDFYVPPAEKNAWRTTLAKDGLIGGGNVRLLIGDEHLLRTSRTLRGQQVVSVPQLILDLLREGGPCREAAELLIQKEYDAAD